MSTQLFTLQLVNGNSASFESRGRVVTLLISGTPDGMTITVQASPDGGTNWIDTTVTATAAGVQNFVSGVGVSHRLKLAGAGAATSINAWIAYGLGA